MSVQSVQEILGRFIEDLQDERVRELFAALPSGKMLRSRLILSIAKSERATFLAAVVEMIHAASLLHDDVIDEATQRRGKPSINASYGNKNAIMLGDILYSKAFYELTKLPDPIPQIISNAVTLLSLGEMLDVELSKRFNSDRELYFDMIYKKTGSLIEASAKAAAHLAGKDIEGYALFGKNLGIAFQIVDDILDVVERSETLGKPAMSDFAEGKATLPYIYLYERLSPKEREQLLAFYKKDLSEEEERWIKERMRSYGVIEACKEEARKLAKEGAEAVDDRGLHKIMESLIERTY